MKQQLKDMRTLFLLGACLLMAACTGRSFQASNDDETKPVITVTLEPQRYFTEAIAGDKFKVVSMVPKGSSPAHKSAAWLHPYFSIYPRRADVGYVAWLYFLPFRKDIGSHVFA